MGQSINFEKLARDETLVFLRLATGDTILPGEQSLLVRVEGEEWHCHTFPPWEEFTADGAGDWYAVNYRSMFQHIGFSDLISYRIASIPGQSFRLGFHADFSIRAAHVPGLLPLMRSRESMRVLDTMNALRAPMQEKIVQVLENVVGCEPPELKNVTKKSDEIQKGVESALFPLLYRNGLCMKPHTFLVRGFSPPMLR